MGKMNMRSCSFSMVSTILKIWMMDHATKEFDFIVNIFNNLCG